MIRSLGQSTRGGLKHAIDLGILATLFIAPLFLGGRHEMGRLVLVSLIALTVTCWTARKLLNKSPYLRWTGLELFAVLSVGLLLFQVTQLSLTMIAALSPNLGDFLPSWVPESENATGFGAWNYLSLTPAWTRGALVMLASYWLLFFVVADHVRDLADVQRVLKWIALASVTMAILGLTQRAFGNGKFLWVYEHPTRSTFAAVNGAFLNQNHFAHFLALGIGPLIFWVCSNLNSQEERSRSKRSRKQSIETRSQLIEISLMVCLCLVVIAGLLTFSRGGVATIFLVSLVVVAALAWVGMLSQRVVLSVALSGGIVTAAILIFGYQSLVDEINTIDHAQSVNEVLSVRLDLWKSMLSAASQFPYFGTGAGSHRDIYPTFMNAPPGTQFSHGESGYVQLLMETGAAGAAIVLALIGFLVFSVVRWFVSDPSPAAKACMVAAGAGLLASAAHSFVDFVWYIPACFTMTVLLLALVCRILQLDSAGKVHATSFTFAYPVALTLGVGIVALCSGMVQQRIGPGMASTSWDRYFALSKHASAEERKGVGGGDEADSERLISDLRIREMQQHLVDTLSWDPSDSRASVRLASLNMQQFKNQQSRLFASMPFDQIVDVVQNTPFESTAAKDEWIQRVLGNRIKLLNNAVKLSEHGIRLSPFEGRAYLMLAESGQLSGWDGEQRVKLLEQAKCVRPFDELVQYQRGIEKLRDGRVDEAVADWKQAFTKSAAIRSLAIDALAPIYSVQQLAELLDDDWQTLYELYRYYRKMNRDNDATYIGGPIAKKIEDHSQLEPSRESAQLLSQAGSVYAHLGLDEDAARCFRKSARLAPTNYRYRYALAKHLLKMKEYDMAVTELKWCRRRKPKDEQVTTQLETAYRMAVTESEVDHSRRISKRSTHSASQR